MVYCALALYCSGSDCQADLLSFATDVSAALDTAPNETAAAYYQQRCFERRPHADAVKLYLDLRTVYHPL